MESISTHSSAGRNLPFHQTSPLTENNSRNQRDNNSNRFALIFYAFLDQGSQSFLNLIVGVLSARLLSAADFGAFSMAFLCFMLSWGAYRALLVEPQIVYFRTGSPSLAVGARSKIIILSLLLSIPLSALGIFFGNYFSGPLGNAFIAFGVIFPFVITLDIIRGNYHAAGQSLKAAKASFLWLLGFVIAYLCLLLTVESSIFTLVTPIGVTAGLLTVIVVIRHRKRSNEKNSGIPFSIFKSVGWPSFQEFLLVGATVHLLGIFVGIFSGFEEAGGFRGAAIIAGPLVTVIAGLKLGFLMDAARYRAHHGDSHWQTYLLKSSVVLLAIAFCISILILWLSVLLGGYLLGETWVYAQPVIIPMMLGIVTTSIHLVCGAVLRARNLSDLSLLTRARLLPLIFVFSWFGLMLNGAIGAAWGLFIGNLISCPFWVLAATSGNDSKKRVLDIRRDKL